MPLILPSHRPQVTPAAAEPVNSLDAFARQKLDDLERRQLRRTLVERARTDGIWLTRRGRRLLSFSCNDYLNLAQHPAVKEAAIDAIQRHGVGAGASRRVTGNHPLFADREARLARLKGAQAACVFGSGYLANAGVIPALLGSDDAVLLDEVAHSCLWAGAQLTRGRILTYRHNDVAHVEALLAEQRARYRHVLIATEGVFSMDGDLAPLPELGATAKKYNAWLLTDDAHGVGVIGGGRGSTFVDGTADLPLQMGTLSKAIGS